MVGSTSSCGLSPRRGGYSRLREHLEALYSQYNRPEFIHPDPLECVYRFADASDREIVGLIASSLAFGGVKQIVASIGVVLTRLENTPSSISRLSETELRRVCAGFKHRYATGEDLFQLLKGVKNAVAEFGSLNACFMVGYIRGNDTVIPALTAFVSRLRERDPRPRNFLLPIPSDGSACKRLHMYLRWMVRRDAVDPGVWEGISPSQLIVPVDTHMFRMAKLLGFTSRSQGDLRAAQEITAAFAQITPQDPVRYDFALTRLGIRSDTTGYKSLATYRALSQGESAVKARSAE
ncbi:MAG: TIGR02757 family protein [Candidatus Hydrogenedentes bacterium]|nr:TIGR02757 family protein [Candidatus Hydrogenedentota bacterium]